MKHFLLLLLFWGLFQITYAQTTCVVDTTVPRVAGIYPDSLPPFTGCNYGEVDVTFVFPRDTTTVLGGQTVTIPFNSFRIDGVAGLPQGINWECNLQPNCFYDLSNSPPDSIGCIRLFGTPTIPGTYPISVLLTVNVQLIGDVATTYDALVTVTPCVFSGSCYTLNLSDNCEPSLLDLTNNIPSNGRNGFSYDWSVTGPNLNYQSNDENPSSQNLVAGGDYVVNYDLMVDTIGFLLDSVVIDSVNCGDFLIDVEPDIYWILTDPSGTQLVNTSANPLNNFNNFPLNIGFPRTLLDTGTYVFEVWDNDVTSPDDGCADATNNGQAAVSFTNPPPQVGANVVIFNGLRVVFYVSNPISTVSCSDTVHIDSLPAVPSITVMGDTFICAGDSVALMVSSTDSVNWYLNGNVIADAKDTILWVKSAGDYQAQITSNATRCVSMLSAKAVMTVATIAPPNISISGTSLSIMNPMGSFSYEWFKDGTMVGMGNSFDANLSGVYWAVAIDNQTGCRSDTSANVQIIIDGLEDLKGIVNGFKLFPNPVTDLVHTELELSQFEAIDYQLFDAMGKLVERRRTHGQIGIISQTFDLQTQPAGIYFMQISIASKRISSKIIKH